MKRVLLAFVLYFPVLLAAQDCINLPDTIFVCGFSEYLPPAEVPGTWAYNCDVSSGVASIQNQGDSTLVKVSNCGEFFFDFVSSDPNCPETHSMLAYFDDPSNVTQSELVTGNLTYNDYGCHGGGSACSFGDGGPVQISIGGATPPAVSWEIDVRGGCSATNFSTEIINADAENCEAEDIFILSIFSSETDSIHLTTSEEYVLEEYFEILDSLSSVFSDSLADNSCELLGSGCPSVCTDNPEMDGDSTYIDTIYTILPKHQGGNWTLIIDEDCLVLEDTTVFNYQGSVLRLRIEPGADYYGPDNIDWYLEEGFISQGDTLFGGINNNYELTAQWKENFTYDTISVQYIERVITDQICYACGGNGSSYTVEGFQGIPSYDCGPISLSFFYDFCVCEPPFVDAQVLDDIDCNNPCTDVILNSYPFSFGNFYQIDGPDGYSNAGQGLDVISVCEPGTYSVLMFTDFGCDAFTSFTVTGDFETFQTSFDAEVCEGSCYNWNGIDYCDPGSFQQEFQAFSNGCDSIVTLNLSIIPMLSQNETAVVCAGECYFWQGEERCGAGEYQETVQDENCMINYSLTLIEESYPELVVTVSNSINCNQSTATLIADGNFAEVYWSNGALGNFLEVSTGGQYTAIAVSASGCESLYEVIVEEDFTIDETFQEEVVCEGETYEGFGPGQYTIESDNPLSGCTDILYLTVEEVSVDFTISATGTNIGCSGEPVFLAVDLPEGTNILWSNASSAAFQTVTAPGIYTATVTGANGCSATNSIEITNETDASVVSEDLFICPGECIDYQGNVICEAGPYSFTITENDGCETEYTGEVLQLSGSIGATLDLPVLTCQEPTGIAYLFVQSELSGFINYDITFPDGSTMQTTDPPLALSITQGGAYGITGTYANGSNTCTTTFDFFIEENTEEILIEPQADQSLDCTTGTAAFTVSDFPDYEYVWTGPGVDFTNVNASEFITNQAGTYTLTVTNPENNCSGVQEFTVSPQAELDFNLTAEASCEGLSQGAIEVLETTGGSGEYLFSIDGENYQSESQFSELSPGIYTVQMQDSNDCTAELQAEVTESAGITLPEQTEFSLCGESFVTLDVSQEAAENVSYMWLNGDETPTFRAVTEGVYDVEVSNECGSEMIEFTVVNRGKNPMNYIYVPNAFAPGSDRNAEFRPFFAKEVTTYEMTVIDRWGNPVFRTLNPEKAWDGTVRGQKASSGVYIYTAQVSMEGCDGLPENVNIAGDVLLIR